MRGLRARANSARRTRFIVVYRVNDGFVEIAALIHAAQRWPTGF